MKVTIHLPSMLRSYCEGAPARLIVEAVSVHESLQQLSQKHPAIYQCVCDEAGAVRRHINLFVNSSLLRSPEELTTPLHPDDELFIMTAVSGG